MTVAAIAVGALLLGTAVFTIVREGVELLWGAIPEGLPDPIMWAYVVILPAIAGAVVALLRRRADGHNPLLGFSFAPVPGSQYPWVLAAVAVTMFGGLVVGPEVALVATGSFVGTEIARRRGDLDEKPAVGIGIGFGILALFIGPIFAGSFDLSPRYQFQAANLIGAVVTAAVVVALLTVLRLGAVGLVRSRGGDLPRPLTMAGLGAVVGLLGLGYVLVSDEPVQLVLTSGEGQIKELAALGTAGAIALATGIKLVAYAVSLGGGFRGGPFFPAIFIGAGVGLVGESLAPGTFTGASAAGMVAAFSYLAHAKWPATVVLGILIGLLTGGWPIIALTIVAAVVARAAPKASVTNVDRPSAAVSWQP